jgi:hypothetical protein
VHYAVKWIGGDSCIVSCVLDEPTVKLIKEKLESIDRKVDREIHGGNGKGLWEEVREVRTSVDSLKEEVLNHLGSHDASIELRKLWIAILGLAVTSAGVIIALIRVIVVTH